MGRSSLSITIQDDTIQGRMDKKRDEIRVRTAPSPTGIPHIGFLRTTLFNWLFAKHNGGKFILRIEDTDRERYVKEAVEEIIISLQILGLEPDEGPEIGGKFGPYVQSKRIDLYQKYAKNLVEKGYAYWCFCSTDRLEKMRADQQKKGQPLRYDGECLSLSKAEVQEKLKTSKDKVIRFKFPKEGKTSWCDLIHNEISFENKLLDDRVILKSDGFPTYHLAVVVDDHLMKISYVLRGDEWISSTPLHLLLYKAFGWPAPEFGHLPLILGPDGLKLSKRHGAKPVTEYIAEGYLSEALVNFMVFLGWNPKTDEEIFSKEELVKRFDLAGVNPTSPVFNIDKLNWFNGVYIRKISSEDLAKRINEFYGKKYDLAKIEKLIPLVKERIMTLSDFEKLSDFFFQDVKVSKELLEKFGGKEMAKANLEKAKAELSKIGDWEEGKMEKELKAYVLKNKLKMIDFFMAIRVAISGKNITPPLFGSLVILGKSKTLERVNSAIKLL